MRGLALLVRPYCRLSRGIRGSVKCMTEVSLGFRALAAHRDALKRRGTVLMLPGRAYSCEMPLLAQTTRALRSDGWVVLQAEWHLEGLPHDPRGFVERAAAQLDAVERQTGPVLVVAKSLGTLAAHWSAERGYPAVWLTPIFRASGLHPMPAESEALKQRIRTYPTDNLVVGGTQDPLWVNGFTGRGEVIELPGADHALETGSMVASARDHRATAAAVVDFASKIG